MKYPDGKTVYVNYSDIELEWLRAANTLPRSERYYALIDIADMAGRVFSSVYTKANRLKYEAEKAAATEGRKVIRDILRPGRIHVPERSVPLREALVGK